MNCPHCKKETSTKYFKDGVGLCEECNRIIEYEEELPKLNFLNSKEIINTPKEKDYLIKNMLPKNAVIQLLSPPANFKSIFALSIAVHIANGKDFLGFKTKKHNVAYLDKENNRQIIADRMKKICKGLNLKRKKFPTTFLLKEGMLDNPTFLEQLIEYVEEEAIGLIIFDTLVRFNSGNENSSQDMNKLYQAFVKLQSNTGATILFLHHTNRMGEFRGSSDLLGQVDCLYKIEKKYKTTKFKISNEKNRMGELNDINGEILFGEDRINILKNEEEAIEEEKIRVNKFQLARAFVCDVGKTLCPSGNHSFTRQNILSTRVAWNSEVCKDSKLGIRSIDSAIQSLKLNKVLLDSEKEGVYRLNYEKIEQISQYVSVIGEGNATKTK
jgi:hypothetical protein